MNADDEAIDRIRAADPARAHETDLVSLRRAVDRRLAEPAAGPRGDEADDGADGDELIRDAAIRDPGASDELAERRRRRTRRNAWVAGIAASVLVGASGYLVGLSSGGSGSDSAGGAAYDGSPDMAATDREAEAAEDGYGAAGSAGGADHAPELGTTDIMPAWSRIVFVASGLSDQAGSAEAFAFDPTGTDAQATVAELAAALGIDGVPRAEGASWSILGSDGRSIQVYDDGTASFGYSDPSLDPWVCVDESGGDPEPDSGSEPESGSAAVPGFAGCPEDASTPADPLGTARAFLTDLGFDLSDLELVVEDSGAGTATVSGHRSGTDPNGSTVNVTVAEGGVYSAWGWLAPLVSLGNYDTVPATTAVERLMDPRFGAFGGMVPYAAYGGATRLDGDTSVSSQPRSPDAPVEPGADIPWPVATRTITDAELVLGTYTLPDSSVVLLPTWSLTSDDGLTWTVIAVADDALDFGAH